MVRGSPKGREYQESFWKCISIDRIKKNGTFLAFLCELLVVRITTSCYNKEDQNSIGEGAV